MDKVITPPDVGSVGVDGADELGNLDSKYSTNAKVKSIFKCCVVCGGRFVPSRINHTLCDECLSPLRPTGFIHNLDNPPAVGTHLYLSDNGRELWVWPLEKNWYHYLEKVDKDDGGCDFNTSKQAISWEAIVFGYPETSRAALIHCLPFDGAYYRDAILVDIADQDPLKPWISPSLAEQIRGVTA
ncbi:MAG: hypothetical protein AB2821_10360 [Candidatus Thiodiazotropha endolucinida]